MSRGRRAFVALGSNLGECAATLESALVELERVPGVRVERVSGFHRTAPVGGPAGQADYLNAVAELRTTLSPEDLLEVLQRIESDHGRDRSREVRNGPRTLDLDLLWFEGEARSTDDLLLPHPRFEERSFVLEPLSELAPEWRLPTCGLRVRERAAALREESLAR